MATRHFDIARHLVRQGHAVTIFASAFGHYVHREIRAVGAGLARDEVIDGVRFVWIRTVPYRRNDLRRVLNMLSFAALACVLGLLRRPRPHVVVGVSVHPLAALSAWILATIRGARFTFEVTDLWPEVLIQYGLIDRHGPTARVLRGLERFLYDRATRIVMLWRDTASYVSGIGADARKIVWVPHGVELDRYADLPPYDGIARRPFTATFLGGFVESNAIDVIVGAAEVLRRRGRGDIRIALIGSGSDKQGWVRRVSELGLSNVDFPPPVPKSRIAAAMAGADAFVGGVRELPLYRFGLSLNKLPDYLASGRPIVFFGRPSYDPVLEAGAGLSVPAEPTAVADALERLADASPEERARMGERGRRFLAEHHLIPKLADRYLAALTGAA